MKISRIVFALIIGILFTAITSTVTPQIVFAACRSATGAPIPCPPRKTPTSIPSTLTPMPTECRLPDGAPCTPTPAACLLAPCTPTPVNTTTSGGCTVAPCTPTPVNTTTSGGCALTPCTPSPCLLADGTICTPTSTPASAPVTGGGGGGFGPLGWILALLIIVVCFGGGFFFFFKKGGGFQDGSDKMGAQPHMDDGSVGNPDLNNGTPSEIAPGPPDMPGSTQAQDFHVKGSTDASNQFLKLDGKTDGLGGSGGEQL